MARSASDRRRLAAAVACLALGTSALAWGGSTSPVAAQGAIGEVVVEGRGWGHGRGMGQFGALGYATGHATGTPWNHRQILDHFYGGTHMATVPASRHVTVWLKREDGRDLLVTSRSPFHVSGVALGPGDAARISLSPAGWRLQTFAAADGGCASQRVVTERHIADPTVHLGHAAGPGPEHLLNICDGAQRRPYRGWLILRVGDGVLRTVNGVFIEEYLRGVVPREMPAGWPQEALRAQAVAARSFALAEGGEHGQRWSWAKTCDSIFCQVYGGAAAEHPNTNLAVESTAGQVRRVTANGRLARTEYSSSTGGWTAGGAFPAVQDLGDSVPSNPNHTWRVALPAAEVASRYGVGTLQSVEVTRRNGVGGAWGGRALEVRIRGTRGSVTISGDQFRRDWQRPGGPLGLGVRSNWFQLTAVAAAPPPATWFLRNSNSTGVAHGATTFGQAGGQVMLCDWNGDTFDTPGVFRDGAWSLRNNNFDGGADAVFSYGQRGDIAVCGDWDGDGRDTPGVFRRGAWFLRNANSAGPHDHLVGFGNGDDVPVVGDWDGDGRDELGVFRRGVWFLDLARGGGAAEISFGYGDPTDRPVTGDWDGDRRDTVGVVRGSQWFLNNRLGTPFADLGPFGYGNPTDRPLTGDFDGDRISTPAVVRDP